ncbi:MAG: PQQ-dependent sugar dehydrogenase [Acidimicrobiia bacterium]
MRALVFAACVFALASAGCSGDPGESTTSPTATSLTGSTTTEPNQTSPSTIASPTTIPTIPISELSLEATTVADGFDNPVLILTDPIRPRFIIVEQPGRLVALDGSNRTELLDISSDVRFGGEQGLLGMAFDPEVATNHSAYLSYTANDGSSIIERIEYRGGVFDPSTREMVLRVHQPAANHNGGMIAFGPDGFLWIGLGDGGAADDRFGNGQRADTLLGALLRIDVLDDGSYTVPVDNPFADGVDGAPEVWAIGLRNPWRFAFDGTDLWIGDVGQNRIEEVDVIDVGAAGTNFGWPIREGGSCFGGASCDTDGLVTPIAEYAHDEGCSVTGGAVYRGAAIPSLHGQFFYADYCSGILLSVARDGMFHDWTEQTGPLDHPTGFGIGPDTELYIVTQNGALLRIATEGA